MDNFSLARLTEAYIFMLLLYRYIILHQNLRIANITILFARKL